MKHILLRKYLRQITTVMCLNCTFLAIGQSHGEVNSSDTEVIEIGYQLIEKTRLDSEYFSEVDENRKGKPISIHLWYPSKKPNNSMNMTYGDYVNYLIGKTNEIENQNLFYRVINSYGGIDSAGYEDAKRSFFPKSTRASKSPEFPQGKYPLIIIGSGSPISQFELAEYIASKGFVVASFPRLGKKQGERLPFDPSGNTEYAKDLSYTLDYLSSLEFVDTDQLSFITWSFEGVPTLELAMKNKATNIFISLDASIGYDYGTGLLKDSTSFYQNDISFPLVHFTGRNMDYGKSFTILDSLSKSTNSITIDQSADLPHANFTSLRSMTIPSMVGEKSNQTYQQLIKTVVLLLLQNN
ncbi:MAG: hypothetical protein GY816_09855 [Cytophagales bacterium]|nr:hypothetical protein [Cytophagales bacterium]